MLNRLPSFLLLVAALPLAGCDLLGGGDKGKDGESIGFACRLSDKLPEDCMKENNTYTPTSILTGWKRADAEKKEAAHSTDKPAGEGGAEGEAKPAGDQASESAAESPEKH